MRGGGLPHRSGRRKSSAARSSAVCCVLRLLCHIRCLLPSHFASWLCPSPDPFTPSLASSAPAHRPSSPIVPSFPRRLRRVVRRVHGRVSTVAAYGADSSPVDPLTGYGDRPDGMSLISARMESLPSSQIDSRSLPYPKQAAATSVDPPSASIPRPTCLLCGAGSGGLQPHEPVHVRARVQDPQQRKRRSRRRRG